MRARESLAFCLFVKMNEAPREMQNAVHRRPADIPCEVQSLQRCRCTLVKLLVLLDTEQADDQMFEEPRATFTSN
jgi:hypothetical protein